MYNWTMDEDDYRPQHIIVICTYLLRDNPWTTDVNRYKQIHNILDSVCQACNFLLCTYTSWSLLLYCYPDFSAQVIKIMRRFNHSFSLGWGSGYNRKEKHSSKRSKFSILTSSSLQNIETYAVCHDISVSQCANSYTSKVSGSVLCFPGNTIGRWGEEAFGERNGVWPSPTEVLENFHHTWGWLVA